jgi:hypothetical protein
MDQNTLAKLAELIAEKNRVCEQITAITGRPALIGHLGEFIAAQIFDIELATSAVNRGFDGVFRSGPMAGRTVNVKWYAKKEGLLDIRPDALPDCFLVLTGPQSHVMHSRGEWRPWLIDSVYLFEATKLVEELQNQGVKIGIATSVRKHLWAAAAIYPQTEQTSLPLSKAQIEGLKLFSRTR